MGYTVTHMGTQLISTQTWTLRGKKGWGPYSDCDTLQCGRCDPCELVSRVIRRLVMDEAGGLGQIVSTWGVSPATRPLRLTLGLLDEAPQTAHGLPVGQLKIKCTVPALLNA